MNWIYRSVRFYLQLTLGFYYSDVVLRNIEKLPKKGPVLLLANHHISLVDPILLVALLPRPVRFIAKAPLFRMFVLGHLVRKMGCIPAYRRQDSGYDKDKNNQLFEKAILALKIGDVVGIFPEGISHDEPFLADLRHGAAKIALEAEADCDFGLNLKIQLVGIHFEKTRRFRGRLLLNFCEPFSLDSMKENYKKDPKQTICDLTQTFRKNLSDLLLIAENEEDLHFAELVDRLEIIPMKEKGLEEHFDRKKAVLEHYQNLKNQYPQKVEVIRTRLRWYGESLKFLRKTPQRDANRKKRQHFSQVLKNMMLLFVGLPFLTLGILINSIPFWLVRLITLKQSQKAARGEDAIAGVGIVAAFLIYPIWYTVLALTGWWSDVPWWIWTTLLLLGPGCGIWAMRWFEGWQQLLQETASLWFSLFNRGIEKSLIRQERVLRFKIQKLLKNPQKQNQKFESRFH